MITKDSIEQAYCFFHQKLRIYSFSTNPNQKDDIEYAINSYVASMNKDLYLKLSEGKKQYLTNHSTFPADLTAAVTRLEQLMQNA